ncbi:MAG: electron transporter RnfC [Desulfovibrionaceae bacterium]|nr:electron transporter RnfC [Desulfovibrionaceae bacterium]
MTRFNFDLQTGETGPLTKAPRPDMVNLPLSGQTPLLGVDDQVLNGTKVSTADNDFDGDMHAPLSGRIREITPHAMRIEVTGDDKAPASAPCTGKGDELRQWLRDRGVNTRNLYPAQTLIINAVPPEPGISIFEPLLRDYRKTLEIGLDLVKRIVEPSKLFQVVAKGNKANAFANCTVTHVTPVYPNGLDPLVIKTVTGREIIPGSRPDDISILSVKDLYLIGRAAETGRPLTETVMTIGDSNQLVVVGTPVGFLTAESGASVQPGDRVVIGGPLRGLAAVNLEQGVDKDASGLHILRRSESAAVTDNPCLGCGQCERHCPARIMPGMISRCAEFKQFRRAEAFHIHSCMECGLCAYWCKAQRPLLQYIRLAKYELALLADADKEPRTETDATDGES